MDDPIVEATFGSEDKAWVCFEVWALGTGSWNGVSLSVDLGPLPDQVCKLVYVAVSVTTAQASVGDFLGQAARTYRSQMVGWFEDQVHYLLEDVLNGFAK